MTDFHTHLNLWIPYPLLIPYPWNLLFYAPWKGYPLKQSLPIYVLKVGDWSVLRTFSERKLQIYPIYQNHCTSRPVNRPLFCWYLLLELNYLREPGLKEWRNALSNIIVGKKHVGSEFNFVGILKRYIVIWLFPLRDNVKVGLLTQVMAMQTAVVYGRLIASHARQLVAPLLKRQNSAKLQLITASCGFSKDFTPAKSKFVYGEDAFFIARNSASDVLGEICFKSCYFSGTIASKGNCKTRPDFNTGSFCKHGEMALQKSKLKAFISSS